MRFALTGALILEAPEFSHGRAVVIADDLIESVVNVGDLPADIPAHDLGGGYLAPGFLDIQVNGGGGALLNETPTLEGVAKIARAHRRYGTTGLLPTVITDNRTTMAQAVRAIAQARRAGIPGVLGIHIEGPFLDPLRRGAHPPEWIRLPDEEDFAMLAGADCGVILMTLAPSRVSPAEVRRLADLGIIVSLGHAEASYEQAHAALLAGARGFTHVFNAMSQMTNREPGMVGAALDARDSFCGIIADGHHVHPANLRAAIAAKKPGTMVLVSDAMPTAAGGPDTFELQGRRVTRHGGRLTLDNGTLAGSDLTMDAALRYTVRELGVALPEALRMAAEYPADFIGLGGSHGRILPGYRADLVWLDTDLRVKKTWIGGQDS